MIDFQEMHLMMNANTSQRTINIFFYFLYFLLSDEYIYSQMNIVLSDKKILKL